MAVRRTQIRATTRNRHEYTHYITIHRASHAVDEIGGRGSKTWAASHATAWAKITPLNAHRRVVAGQDTETRSHEIRLRDRGVDVQAGDQCRHTWNATTVEYLVQSVSPTPEGDIVLEALIHGSGSLRS